MKCYLIFIVFDYCFNLYNIDFDIYVFIIFRCMMNKVMLYMNIFGKKNKYVYGGLNYFKLVKGKY